MPPTLKKQSSSSQSSKNQKTLFGFFQKKDVSQASQSSPASPKSAALPARTNSVPKKPTRAVPNHNLTPVPSSDAIDESEPATATHKESRLTGLPSPTTPANGVVTVQTPVDSDDFALFSSPSRRVSLCWPLSNAGANSAQAKKKVNYAESTDGEEDDLEAFELARNERAGRKTKRRKVVESEDEADEFVDKNGADDGEFDDGAEALEQF